MSAGRCGAPVILGVLVRGGVRAECERVPEVDTLESGRVGGGVVVVATAETCFTLRDEGGVEGVVELAAEHLGFLGVHGGLRCRCRYYSFVCAGNLKR